MIALSVVTVEDWALWRRLRLAALREDPAAFSSRLADWQGAGDREERWRDRLGMPDAFNLVALLDNSPAGMVSSVPTDRPDEVELISMWVHRRARGRGVSDALVEAVVEHARGQGKRAVCLSVAEHNVAAFALYRRHGFVPAPELDKLMPDGVRREVGQRLVLG